MAELVEAKRRAFLRQAQEGAGGAKPAYGPRLAPAASARYAAGMSDDQPSAGRFEGRAHLLPVRIYYEDTDFSGLVYHANYLRYFERGRSDFLRLAGVRHAELLAGDNPTAFAVNRMELDFLKPARIDDALMVKTHYDLVRGPRIQISQSLERAGEVLVRALVEACCISLTGRAKKPPALLLERLKPFLQG